MAVQITDLAPYITEFSYHFGTPHAYGTPIWSDAQQAKHKRKYVAMFCKYVSLITGVSTSYVRRHLQVVNERWYKCNFAIYTYRNNKCIDDILHADFHDNLDGHMSFRLRHDAGILIEDDDKYLPHLSMQDDALVDETKHLQQYDSINLYILQLHRLVYDATLQALRLDFERTAKRVAYARKQIERATKRLPVLTEQQASLQQQIDAVISKLNALNKQ